MTSQGKEIFSERIRSLIEKYGCTHIGNHPKNFTCIDCEDNAEDCNCNDCFGVFCEQCQEIVWISCDDIRTAYREKEGSE